MAMNLPAGTFVSIKCMRGLEAKYLGDGYHFKKLCSVSISKGDAFTAIGLAAEYTCELVLHEWIDDH